MDIYLLSGAKSRLGVPVTTSGGFMAKTTWRTNYDAAPGFIAGVLAATVSYFRKFLFQQSCLAKLNVAGKVCAHTFVD